MSTELYKHIVQYYETDKMGITHHSNYIRWMEEARIDFLDKNGWNYSKLEEDGIISPVVSVNCDYKISTKFQDVIAIKVNVSEYKGVKLVIEYDMCNADDRCVCKASSVHTFIDESGKLIRLSKEFPEFHETLVKLSEK